MIYKPWVRWDGNGAAGYYGRDFDLANSDWEHVVYSQDGDVNSILGQHNSNAMSPKPNIDIALPFGRNNSLGINEKLVTVGDVTRIWTIGPKDKLLDPLDSEDPNNTAFHECVTFDVSKPT